MFDKIENRYLTFLTDKVVSVVQYKYHIYMEKAEDRESTCRYNRDMHQYW